jgi:hypothetical protein
MWADFFRHACRFITTYEKSGCRFLPDRRTPMRRFDPRCSLRRAALGAAAAVLFILVGYSRAAAGAVDGTIWMLTGTSTTRVGPYSSSKPFTATLTLNADRIYTLRFTNALFPDNVGVWFENKGRVLLYQQNLLIELQATELALQAAAGEPVELQLLKYGEDASVKKTHEMLKFRATYQFNASVLSTQGVPGQSNSSVPTTPDVVGLTVMLNATGIPGP